MCVCVCESEAARPPALDGVGADDAPPTPTWRRPPRFRSLPPAELLPFRFIYTQPQLLYCCCSPAAAAPLAYAGSGTAQIDVRYRPVETPPSSPAVPNLVE